MKKYKNYLLDNYSEGVLMGYIEDEDTKGCLLVKEDSAKLDNIETNKRDLKCFKWAKTIRLEIIMFMKSLKIEDKREKAKEENGNERFWLRHLLLNTLGSLDIF